MKSDTKTEQKVRIFLFCKTSIGFLFLFAPLLSLPSLAQTAAERRVILYVGCQNIQLSIDTADPSRNRVCDVYRGRAVSCRPPNGSAEIERLIRESEACSFERRRRASLASCNFGTFSSWATDAANLRSQAQRSLNMIPYIQQQYSLAQLECRHERERARILHSDNFVDRELARTGEELCRFNLETWRRSYQSAQQRAALYNSCADYAERRARGLSEEDALRATSWP